MKGEKMKKITTMILAILMIVGFSTTMVLAQPQNMPQHHKKNVKGLEIIHGTISSIDTAKNEVVVKNNKTGVEKIIPVNADAISTFTVGEEVKVKMKEGDTKNIEIVKVVKEKKKQ
jgi:hypothetical protein